VDDKSVETTKRGENEKEAILTRLRRIEGQVRGIQRMIEENRDCEAIVTQLMAARAALDRASLLIMSRHIERCLLDSNAQTSRARLERIIGLFLRFADSSPEPEEAHDGERAEGNM